MLKQNLSPGPCGLVGACPVKQKSDGSQSGHMPRLQVRSPGGVRIRGDPSMFLSLSSPLFKIKKHVFWSGQKTPHNLKYQYEL